MPFSGVKIIKVEEIAAGCFHMLLEKKKMAEKALPGQFLHIRVSNNPAPLLRRPFSIAGASPDEGLLRIFFRLRGKGTELLSGLRPGDLLDCLGPLGTGFRFTPDSADAEIAVKAGGSVDAGVTSEAFHTVLLGGGIGVAPLLFLAQTLQKKHKDRKIILFYGAPRLEEMIPVHEYLPPGVRISLATDDGSAGFKGVVSDLCQSRLQNGLLPEEIFACGPPQMLQTLTKMEILQNIRMQFSLEERMACGVGACLGCAVETRARSGDKAETAYKRVCRDGPVFDSSEVIW